MRSAKVGRERHVVRLVNAGKELEAARYMSLHGMVGNFAGAPQDKPVGAGALDLTQDGPALAPLGAAAQEVQKAPEAVQYPDFKPAREAVPGGVRYGRILRELGNELMKKAICEDDGEEVLLWMSLREQQGAKNRRGRLIGQVFAIEKNPDEAQGGWRIWRRT